MATALPTKDMTVAEVLDAWPETVEVFQALKTACVGCVMAPFDTLADVARIYELDLDTVMEKMHQAARSGQSKQPATPSSSTDKVD